MPPPLWSPDRFRVRAAEWAPTRTFMPQVGMWMCVPGRRRLLSMAVSLAGMRPGPCCSSRVADENVSTATLLAAVIGPI
jgi:hypothetical protein